ncbi:hypothetical protein V8C34DRAFT_297595 [Trichoderma compactum]
MPSMLHVSCVVFVSSSDADRPVCLLSVAIRPRPSAAPPDTDHKRLVAPEYIHTYTLAMRVNQG